MMIEKKQMTQKELHEFLWSLVVTEEMRATPDWAFIEKHYRYDDELFVAHPSVLVAGAVPIDFVVQEFEVGNQQYDGLYLYNLTAPTIIITPEFVFKRTGPDTWDVMANHDSGIKDLVEALQKAS